MQNCAIGSLERKRTQLNCTARWKTCVANETPAGRGCKRLTRREPKLNCCKNVTPVIGVRGLASGPERNRCFRIQLVGRVRKRGVGARTGPYPLPHAPIVRSRLTSGEGRGGEPDHGSSTTETPNRVDRRG